jgi:Ca-activated chloride channel family protein
VTVEIEAGVQVSNVRSTSHQIRTTKDGRILRVELAKQDTIPNKDLILRYQVAGKETQSTVLADADERGGHFATYLIPAVQYQTNEIVPKDVVFLMDTSGSQSGDPLVNPRN